MRKLLLFLLLASTIYADCDWTVKARVAAFIPVNSRFRDIYGSCIPSYELEVSKGFSQNSELWGNINGFTKKGRSIGLRDSTRIHVLNLSIGAKYVYNFTCYDQAYIGLGAVISDLWLRNDTHLQGRRASKAVFGGVLKLGFIHYFTENVFIDLFADYYYQPVRFSTHVDIGGLKTGVGLGYRF